MKLILVFIITLFSLACHAQELNCKVELNSDKVEGTNKEVFTTLKEAITEYMNTNKWGTAQFASNERIDCTLFFTIKSVTDNTFSGDLQVQSRRPVYNSSYTTTLINFKDTKIDFSYQQYEPLTFSENVMESNLTAILNFYAYMILAIDFDSFSQGGGTPYFDKAQNVVTLAQSSSESGWKAFDDNKNRSALLSAFTDVKTSDIRMMNYLYHRKGLDEMALTPEKARAQITKSLSALSKVYEVSPMSVLISLFSDTKFDELVNIYSKAGDVEKNTVYELLKSIYPTETTRLNNIKNPAK